MVLIEEILEPEHVTKAHTLMPTTPLTCDDWAELLRHLESILPAAPEAGRDESKYFTFNGVQYKRSKKTAHLESIINMQGGGQRASDGITGFAAGYSTVGEMPSSVGLDASAVLQGQRFDSSQSRRVAQAAQVAQAEAAAQTVQAALRANLTHARNLKAVAEALQQSDQWGASQQLRADAIEYCKSHSAMQEAAEMNPALTQLVEWGGSDVQELLDNLRHCEEGIKEVASIAAATRIGRVLRGWGQPSANGLTTAGGVHVAVQFHDAAPGPPQASGATVAGEQLLNAYTCSETSLCLDTSKESDGSSITNPSVTEKIDSTPAAPLYVRFMKEREHENMDGLLGTLSEDHPEKSKAHSTGYTSKAGSSASNSEQKLRNAVSQAQTMLQQLRQQGRHKEAAELQKELMRAGDTEDCSSDDELSEQDSDPDEVDSDAEIMDVI